MTAISTLGGTSKAIIQNQEDGSIDRSFVCATLIVAGTPVKLLTTGLIAPIAAVTDVVFGHVSVGNKAAGEKATVKTPFSMVQLAEADGTIDEGNHLACSGMNTAGTLPKMKVAVATNWVCAICLTGGLTTTEQLVGILRVPYLKA